uniref:Uncharacterized protein n=1 Tax=Palmaria palmata TaxID=2822 RepID=A0A1C9CH45_PALPL|nr:hypothetical protein Palma_072 [Palmaria palmata]AOM67704.1 hypothetical protein Palma_072 [Palmaria palmata]
MLRLSSQAANIQLPIEKISINTSINIKTRNELLIIKTFQQEGNLPYTVIDNSKILTTESAYRFAKLNSYNRVLFKDLVNKYWQQSIFLSAFNSTTDKYITKLTRQRSASTKDKQKRFFIDFNKALVSDPISASGITARLPHHFELNSPVKYIWKKGFNLQKPRFLPRVSFSSLSRSTPKITHVKLLQSLTNSHLPLYVVVNGFKQIIIPGPPNDFSNKETFNNVLRQWYHNTFLENQNEHVAYQGWFFVNPQDALEYKAFIANKKNGTSTESPLGILPTRFDSYYRLNRKVMPRTEFRLFPDIEEVEKILYAPKYKKNLVIDSRQNIGTSSFQGQPIYLIEPTKCSVKGGNQKINFIPHYKMPMNSPTEASNPIFLTKTSALNAWAKISAKYPEYRLPSIPKLRLYNLEDFLKDQEVQESPENFILMPGPGSSIPNLESLQLINSHGKLQHIEAVSSRPILASKLWLHRLVWSLTRRKPPQWEV